MAENTRVRLEGDIEQYLKSQAERVLGKSPDFVTGADLTTLTNRLLYEHRLAHSFAARIPFGKLFNWLMNLDKSGSQVVSNSRSPDKPALKSSEPEDSFDFDADLADQFEDAA